MDEIKKKRDELAALPAPQRSPYQQAALNQLSAALDNLAWHDEQVAALALREQSGRSATGTTTATPAN